MMISKESCFNSLWFFWWKETAGGAIKKDILSNEEFGEELHKPIIRKLKKKTLPFIDNLWGADLGDMQLLSKFKHMICFFKRYKRVLQLLMLFKKS